MSESVTRDSQNSDSAVAVIDERDAMRWETIDGLTRPVDPGYDDAFAAPAHHLGDGDIFGSERHLDDLAPEFDSPRLVHGGATLPLPPSRDGSRDAAPGPVSASSADGADPCGLPQGLHFRDDAHQEPRASSPFLRDGDATHGVAAGLVELTASTDGEGGISTSPPSPGLGVLWLVPHRVTDRRDA